MTVVAAGLDFRSAPVEVRERAVVGSGEAPSLLRYLVGHSGLAGAAVLSTCNRTEFYVMAPDRQVAAEIAPRLARYLDPSGGEIGELMWSCEGADAVRHMFRVASGLESMLLGEAQVLGQFRRAHTTARQAGTLDPRLDFVMRRALSVGKRVRTETAIGRGVGSLSEAALDQARSMAGPLGSLGVLVIGAGKMSASAAKRLVRAGARVYVSSRSTVSASAVTERIGGTAVRADDLVDVAADVDLVLCSTNSATAVLTAADVEAMQARREHRGLLIIDLAVPRDVEPAAGAVAGVTLVDLDGVGARLERSLRGRRAEVPAADAIVEREVAHTLDVVGQRDAAHPTIAALTRAAEQVRRSEVERTLSRSPGLDAASRADVERLTQSLVRKLLHGPIDHLRRNADDPNVALVLRDAFGLDEEVEGGGK